MVERQEFIRVSGISDYEVRIDLNKSRLGSIVIRCCKDVYKAAKQGECSTFTIDVVTGVITPVTHGLPSQQQCEITIWLEENKHIIIEEYYYILSDSSRNVVFSRIELSSRNEQDVREIAEYVLKRKATSTVKIEKHEVLELGEDKQIINGEVYVASFVIMTSEFKRLEEILERGHNKCDVNEVLIKPRNSEAISNILNYKLRK